MPQNINVLLGAGVFGIVCAATLYIVEHLRQDRRRHAMSKDLDRLNVEMTVLRKQLDTLLAQQNQKYFYGLLAFNPVTLWGVCRKSKSRRVRRTESTLSNSVANEDYLSTGDADSSDLEFFDVSDDESRISDQGDAEGDLLQIDRKLDEATAAELQSCVDQLRKLCVSFPQNPQLFWRLAKGYYKLYKATKRPELIDKGFDACTAGLKLKPELASVHKWMAILIGERAQLRPMKEKVSDAHLFRKHVDAALKLDPMDETVHHMLGRFAYDLAELKWYERKVASALFADPPTGSYSEALEHFQEAEHLCKKDWKENLLYIAKCYMKLGDVPKAVGYLEKAAKVNTTNDVDDVVDVEVKEMLRKHSK